MSGQPEITASLIKELRERTGVGMAKCKEALVSANGDIEEAIDILRKAGIASAVKKEGRTTNEGTIVTARKGNTLAVLEANAETDFVVRNEKFQSFIREVVDVAAEKKPASLSDLLALPYPKDTSLTIDQFRATLVQAIGENIQLRRLELVTVTPDVSLGLYSHLDGRIVTVVVIQGGSGEEALAKDIAMHAAATAPEVLAPSDLPPDVIAREREIATSQMQGKPANMIDKIVEGKLNAYYDSVCLVRQKFVKDDSVTIQQLVDDRAKATGKPLAITTFLYWAVRS